MRKFAKFKISIFVFEKSEDRTLITLCLHWHGIMQLLLFVFIVTDVTVRNL
jgi:hypothetical protein